MSTLLNRMKGRPRQSSVSAQDLNERSIPYDKLSTPIRSPPLVGTLSQGIKGISAPNTNPDLTANGTEFNKYSMQRSRQERERVSESFFPRQNSPNPSISTDSTLFDDAARSIVSPSKPTMRQPASARLTRQEVSSPSPSRQNMDFGQYATQGHRSSTRPNSGMTLRSESNRTSAYAMSLSTSESGSHSPFSLHHRHHAETFNFPRPKDDAEIEVLFENVKRERGFSDLSMLNIDQKWHIVYNDEQIRWNEERQREEQSRKQQESGQAGAIMDTPEWYIRKFVDKTITAKQVGSLAVSLRTKEVGWFAKFISTQGTLVLAQTLQNLSRKGSTRSNAEMTLEYEIAKCLRLITNAASNYPDAFSHATMPTLIASSLNSPYIPTRKIILEILIYLAVSRNAEAHPQVLAALETLSISNNDTHGSFDYWFKSMEQSLSGRGKMGSLVGASEEVRKAGSDGILNDYALTNLYLISAILTIDDFDLRLHYRSQMESAGLRRIFELCSAFSVSAIDMQIDNIETIFRNDEQALRERLDQDILKDLGNPQDVYNAIFHKTQGTMAHQYFLSIMQHLLLIREEGSPLVHYYQLLDSMVTDVVLNKKLAGAEQRVGLSVERLIAQFNESERLQSVEGETTELRALVGRLKLEKEGLEAEVAQGHDGLVGNLKDQIASLEQKLAVSRETTTRMQSRMEAQKKEDEEKIAQLEAQIMELFRMLKEVGKGVETILDGGSMDRKALVQTLEKSFQRNKTISILEGKESMKRRKELAAVGVAQQEEDDDPEATPRKPATGGKGAGNKPAAMKLVDENGRISQFMDADDDDARDQVQQQLAVGAKMYSPQMGTLQSARSIRGSPRRPDRPPLGSDISKGGSLLAPRAEDATSIASTELSRSSSPTNEDESDFGRSTTRSGLTEDTVVTSIDGEAIMGQSAPPGSFADQLQKHFLNRSKSLRDNQSTHGSAHGKESKELPAVP
ncbi:hypothetical protein CVT24_003056, partial [Panaeolus cyanescens]